MSSVLASSSYFNAYQKQKAAKKMSAVERERLLTDRSAYVSFLEVQLERVASACLTTEGFDGRIAQVLEKLARVDEKVVHVSRAFKMMHAYGEEQGKDFDGRIANVAARTAGIEAIVGEHREHADSHIATSREAMAAISQAQIQLQEATLTATSHLDELRSAHDGHANVSGRTTSQLRDVGAELARVIERNAARETSVRRELRALEERAVHATRERSDAQDKHRAFEDEVAVRFADVVDTASAQCAEESASALAAAMEAIDALRVEHARATAAVAKATAANAANAELAAANAATALAASAAAAEAANAASASIGVAVADAASAAAVAAVAIAQHPAPPAAASPASVAPPSAAALPAAPTAPQTASVATSPIALAATPSPAAPALILTPAAFNAAMRSSGDGGGGEFRTHVQAWVREAAAVEVERLLKEQLGSVVAAAAEQAVASARASARSSSSSELLPSAFAAELPSAFAVAPAARTPSELLAAQSGGVSMLLASTADDNSSSALEQRVRAAEAICRQLAEDSIRRAQSNRQHIVAAFAVSVCTSSLLRTSLHTSLSFLISLSLTHTHVSRFISRTRAEYGEAY